jgi:intergrase/recombinase
LNNKSINPEEKNNISTENIDIPIEMTEEITKETKITNSLEEINDKNQKAFQEGLNKELEDNISEKKFYQAERNFQGFLF